MDRAFALIACVGAATLTLAAQTPARDPAPPSPDSATTIRGRVLIAGTEVPVRKARVTLTPDTGGQADPVYADNDGWFTFAGLKPGRYVVTAWKSGYVETKFGARGFWDRHVSVAAVAGRAVDTVTVTLEKGAAVSGRVVDELGEPLVGLTVVVGRVITTDGRLRLESGNFTTETDDLGEYRVGGLPPGTFAVAIYGFPSAPSPLTFTAPDGRTITTMVRRPRTVYHPAAPTLMQARPITLKAGEDATGVDVTFRADVNAVRISGRLVDPLGRGDYFSLAVASDGSGIPQAVSTMNTSVTPDGEFSMAVGPGEYSLVAQNRSGVAIQHVTVGETDVSGLQLVLVKGARVTGHLEFDGAAPPRSPRVLVEARSPESLNGTAIMGDGAPAGQRVPVRPDGTFTLSGLVGRRELIVDPRDLRGWRVASIAAGGRELLNLPLDFKGDEDLRDVVITLTQRTSELAGTVTDANDRPVNVSVLVFAEDRRLLPGRARWVRPDTLGRFVVDGLPAGDYLVALAADVDDRQWSTAVFLEPYREHATRVRITERENGPLALRWTTP